MGTTSRLFSLIQILRNRSKPIRAAELAEALEVSVRTIYRDIAELQAQQVPVEGEAGIGYIMRAGFDMPPLMLTPNEIEAAIVGANWVAQQGDGALAQGAKDLIAKIETVVPSHLRCVLVQPSVTVPPVGPVVTDRIDSGLIRQAIRDKFKIYIEYEDGVGKQSSRYVWPMMVAYFEQVRLLVGWCESRQDFRHFRTDRILSVQITEQKFEPSVDSLVSEWEARGLNRVDAL